ncbi:MAG: helix-turn-helix domain-containing protein [bacterium]
MAEQPRKRVPAEERRSAILAAAIPVFAANGYERATTREIARAAGVAEGTLYRHFAGKRELLTAVMQSLVLLPISNILATGATTDDDAIVQALLRDRFEEISRHRDLLKVILAQAFFDSELASHIGEQVFTPVMTIVSEYFNRRIADGVFAPMPPEVPMRAIMGIVFSQMLFSIMFPQNEQTAAERELLIHQLSSLILDGVRTKEVTA